MSDGKRSAAARPSPARRKSRKKTKVPTGLERGPDGAEVGVDPRRLSPDDLRALGHRGKPLLQAMRKRCVDCCGGKTDEVRQCTAVSCPLWPYRMATDPWHPEPAPPRAETKSRPVAEAPPPGAVTAQAAKGKTPPLAPAASAPEPEASAEAKPPPKAAPVKKARSPARASSAASLLPFMDIA